MSIKVNKMLHKGQFVTAVSAFTVMSVQVMAQSPFVDTIKLKSHVHMGPPPVILAPDHIMSRAEHQFKQIAVENTPGAADKVAKAKKTGRLSLGYDDGINTFAGQAAHRGADGYLMGSLRRDDANKYKGGDGETVDFGYKRTMGQLVAGLTPNADTELKFVTVLDHIDDNKQPHHSMDPVQTDRHVGKAFLNLKDVGMFKKLQGHIGGVDLNRRANNFDLRSAASQMRVEVDRTAYEGGINGTFEAAGFNNAIGFSAKHDDLLATRYNVGLGDAFFNYRFPGIKSKSASLWGDTSTNLGENTKLKAGLRYDILNSDATKVDRAPTVSTAAFQITARELYTKYYGDVDTTQTDHKFSGKLRLEQDVSLSNGMFFGEVSRMERSPSDIERWHSLDNPASGSDRWIGNPDLETEKHHKIELGMSFKGDGYKDYQRSKPKGSSWNVGFSGYYDNVTDFVTLDKANGQSGILQSDLATISRNVDATLIGGSAEFAWNVNPNVSTKLIATYTYGDNDTDNRPLYQVRPFETYWLVDYKDDLDVIGTWNVGSKLRFSGRQDRLDDSTATGLGMDNDGTSGAFATLDLYGGVQLYNQIGLSFSVDNVFDKHYNEHITGEHVASVYKSAITAPGRSFFIRAVANF